MTGSLQERGGPPWPDDAEPVVIALAIVARMAELEATNARLAAALAEAIEETLWDAYNIGFERNGQWMDGARSEGEWLQRELGLEDGIRHDAAMIRERIPALAREMAARAALTKGTTTTGGENG